MKEIAVIIDDIVPVSSSINRILNKERYSDIVLKKVKLSEFFVEQYKDHIDTCYLIKSSEEKNKVEAILKNRDDLVILYIPSNFIVSNDGLFLNLLKKIRYTNSNILLDGNIKIYKSVNDYFDKGKFENMNEEMFLDLSLPSNFHKFISNEAAVRHFNALTSDGYTFVKSSSQKNKIKSEYHFYYLLPDSMKTWFVQPFDYSEDESKAYYKMERFRIPDSAIYHVNNSFNPSEFKEFIDKIFYFIKLRKSIEVTPEQYYQIMDDLYVKKLKQRTEELKKCEEYENLASKIKFGTEYNSIDDIVNKYLELYEQVREKMTCDKLLYIGHGDLCFSNILYDKESYIMKFIDPKGASKEEDLYTNEFYDIAKLSHSVLGDYDFYNSGLFEINIENDLKYCLQSNSFEEIELNKKYFKEKLNSEGYDYKAIRVLECSLFLSMLPLHIDYPAKVFAFILNAIKILKEVDEDARKI